MSIEKTSVFISLILRHKPDVIGISLDNHGWANVEQLIDGINQSGKYRINMDLLKEIVNSDGKQRYSFNDDYTHIRANQGHSIPVDVELECKEPPALLYHGTGEKYVSSIQQQGLIPKSRLYVHLSADLRTAENVGKRHGKPALYLVKAMDMYKAGIKFHCSKNGVWLVDEVPVCYLERINRRDVNIASWSEDMISNDDVKKLIDDYFKNQDRYEKSEEANEYENSIRQLLKTAKDEGLYKDGQLRMMGKLVGTRRYP